MTGTGWTPCGGPAPVAPPKPGSPRARLRASLEEARREVASWPDWMRAAVPSFRFASPDLSRCLDDRAPSVAVACEWSRCDG